MSGTDRVADRRTCRERESEREPATRSLNVLMLAFTERCDITAYKIAHRELNYFWPSPLETARTLVPACNCEEGITQIAVVASIENAKLSEILWGWHPLQVVQVNQCFRDRLLSVIRALTWLITWPFQLPYPHQAGASRHAKHADWPAPASVKICGRSGSIFSYRP